MKILILGSSGMLGSTLTKDLSQTHDVITLGRNKPVDSNNHIFIDVNNSSKFSIYLRENSFDVIINSLAIIDHNHCDLHPEKCLKINSLINKTLVDNISSSTVVIFISSDAVFSDESIERYPTTPTFSKSVYGISKELGERFLLFSKSPQNFLIIRTTILGFSPKKKGFIEWLVGNIENNKTITLFDDVYFNPISIYELSATILTILNKKNYSRDILHINNSEITTKYTFGFKLVEKLGLNTNLILKGKLLDYENRGSRCFNQTLSTLNSPLTKNFTTESTINSLIEHYENKNKI